LIGNVDIGEKSCSQNILEKCGTSTVSKYSKLLEKGDCLFGCYRAQPSIDSETPSPQLCLAAIS
jgi:hypothetical protein